MTGSQLADVVSLNQKLRIASLTRSLMLPVLYCLATSTSRLGCLDLSVSFHRQSTHQLSKARIITQHGPVWIVFKARPVLVAERDRARQPLECFVAQALKRVDRRD